MTPEELDEAITEGLRDRGLWTPPEVDPDILAFREWATTQNINFGFGGLVDVAYLTGARMAREQERERAKPLAQYLQDRADRDDAEAAHILAKYRGEA